MGLAEDFILSGNDDATYVGKVEIVDTTLWEGSARSEKTCRICDD